MTVQDSKFFKGIDEGVVKEIDKVSSVKSFSVGDTVFEKGSSAETLYILDQGNIDLVLKKEDNLVYSLNKPGEVFGWSSLVENGIYTSTAICSEDASVLCISRQDIENILNQNLSTALVFYRRLGQIFSKRISKAVE